MADQNSRMGCPQYSRFERNQPRETCERPSATMADFLPAPSIPTSLSYDTPPTALGSHDRLNLCFPVSSAADGYPRHDQQQQPQSSSFLPLRPQHCLWSPTDVPLAQPSACYNEHSPLSHTRESCNLNSCTPDPSYAYHGQPLGGRLFSNGYHEHRTHLTNAIFDSPFGHDTLQSVHKAPRQRTQFACRYCRKRKTRCSGYQSAQGGRCQSCARMGLECSFQTVTSSAAFTVSGDESLRRSASRR